MIAAGLTSIAFLGDYTYFGTTPTALGSGVDWLAIPICGVAGGLMGGLFSPILILMARGLPGPLGRAIKRYQLLNDD